MKTKGDKMKKVTMATLQKAIRNCGQPGVYFDGESKPCEMDNSGNIDVCIDHDYKLEFRCNNATFISAVYWEDVDGSREEAIKQLISDIELGFEPMCEGTAWACGIDL